MLLRSQPIQKQALKLVPMPDLLLPRPEHPQLTLQQKPPAQGELILLS
jgi:hypothetical protein